MGRVLIICHRVGQEIPLKEKVGPIKACLERGNFFLFSCFSYEIELIHVKFLHDFRKISVF